MNVASNIAKVLPPLDLWQINAQDTPKGKAYMLKIQTSERSGYVITGPVPMKGYAGWKIMYVNADNLIPGDLTQEIGIFASPQRAASAARRHMNDVVLSRPPKAANPLFESPHEEEFGPYSIAFIRGKGEGDLFWIDTPYSDAIEAQKHAETWLKAHHSGKLYRHYGHSRSRVRRNPLYESPRSRRLKHDLEGMKRLKAESTIFDFTATGDPPEKYLVTFKGKSFAGPDKVVDRQEVEIDLPLEYPRGMPNILWKSKVFHPNISSGGGVCLGSYFSEWSPAAGVVGICGILWDMARWANFNINSAYNGSAAEWYRTQTKYKFPIDVRSLRDKVEPPSDAISSKPACAPPDEDILIIENPATSLQEGDRVRHRRKEGWVGTVEYVGHPVGGFKGVSVLWDHQAMLGPDPSVRPSDVVKISANPSLLGKPVPVYDAGGKIIGHVPATATSVAASKIIGGPAEFSFRYGRPGGWVQAKTWGPKSHPDPEANPLRDVRPGSPEFWAPKAVTWSFHEPWAKEIQTQLRSFGLRAEIVDRARRIREEPYVEHVYKITVPASELDLARRILKSGKHGRNPLTAPERGILSRRAASFGRRADQYPLDTTNRAYWSARQHEARTLSEAADVADLELPHAAAANPGDLYGKVRQWLDELYEIADLHRSKWPYESVKTALRYAERTMFSRYGRPGSEFLRGAQRQIAEAREFRGAR